MPPSVAGFLPLTHLLYVVLLSLAEEPNHPYELVKRIRERSDGRIDPGTGSFYSVLAQAERQGLIRECPTAPATRPDTPSPGRTSKSAGVKPSCWSCHNVPKEAKR